MRLPMKFGVSLADHNPLAKAVLRERRDARDDDGIGVCRRDDLEQAHIARRIEEVRAEKVPAEDRRRPSAIAPIGMPEVFD